MVLIRSCTISTETSFVCLFHFCINCFMSTADPPFFFNFRLQIAQNSSIGRSLGQFGGFMFSASRRPSLLRTTPWLVEHSGCLRDRVKTSQESCTNERWATLASSKLLNILKYIKLWHFIFIPSDWDLNP